MIYFNLLLFYFDAPLSSQKLPQIILACLYKPLTPDWNALVLFKPFVAPYRSKIKSKGWRGHVYWTFARASYDDGDSKSTLLQCYSYTWVSNKFRWQIAPCWQCFWESWSYGHYLVRGSTCDVEGNKGMQVLVLLQHSKTGQLWHVVPGLCESSMATLACWHNPKPCN